MKTEPFAHQLHDVAHGARHTAFADLSEQGTGKTWTLLAEAEWWFARKEITRLLVVAPRGVHDNWIEQCELHLEIPWRGVAWRSGSKPICRSVTQLCDPQLAEGSSLKILTINYEALLGNAGFAAAECFLTMGDAACVFDESHYIKEPTAARTKRCIQLARLAKKRRIATGTPISKAPADFWSQFACLGTGLLRFSSREAMMRRYAHLLPANHPLVRHVMARTNAKRPPMIVDKERGSWKNLEELNAIVAPHSRRNRKRDCLDLPDKLYQVVRFDLSPAQQRAYEAIAAAEQLPDHDAELLLEPAVVITTKLRQITSGFILDEHGMVLRIEATEKLAALRILLEGRSGPVIVWAHFREEIRIIADALQQWGLTWVEYHGGVPSADRIAGRRSFSAGEVDVFLGTPAAGGTGLTLTIAEAAIYFSNSFNPIHRSQSEDRCHRIGTRHPVTYYDLVARGTIDERVLRALHADNRLAAQLLGDDL